MKKLFFTLFFILNISVFPQKLTESAIRHALDLSVRHLKRSIEEVKDTAMYPCYAPEALKWNLWESRYWTSGFYPGCLWKVYDLTGNTEFFKLAKKWTNGLEKEKYNKDTHDLGFMLNCSFGEGLKYVKDEEAEKYKNILLQAALTLDKRYNEKVGLLRCYWDEKPFSDDTTLYPVVIDIMMNLELMLWASENGAPLSLRKHAIEHAEKSFRDFVRTDGSTYHVVRYNKNTAEIVNRGTLQGQNDRSTWTRGHAWFTYGMTVMYRYTKDQEFLEKACALADFFIEKLTPDNLSDWDFNANPEYKNIKDASATAIVSSALFELSSYVKQKSLKKKYYDKARDMLAALCSDKCLNADVNTSPILLHSTQYLTQPGNKNTDKPAIFADYYFLEAIQRYLASAKK